MLLDRFTPSEIIPAWLPHCPAVFFRAPPCPPPSFCVPSSPVLMDSPPPLPTSPAILPLRLIFKSHSFESVPVLRVVNNTGFVVQVRRGAGEFRVRGNSFESGPALRSVVTNQVTTQHMHRAITRATWGGGSSQGTSRTRPGQC